MARVKWNKNDVSFSRGNHRPVIFKCSNSTKWITSSCMCTTQTAKAIASGIAKKYGVESVEMKYMWNDDNVLSVPEEDIVEVVNLTDDDGSLACIFRIEIAVPEGCKRQFKHFEESEIFNF